MELFFQPAKSIVPLFGLDDENRKSIFLGTATFVGSHPWLITADHVAGSWNGRLAISPIIGTKFYPANIIARDKDADLAVLDVIGYKPDNLPIVLAEGDEPPQSLMVVSFEYGTTRSRGDLIHLAPATRLGNITRKLDLSEKFGKAGEGILELSFPALRGASGAPILLNGSFELWGIIIANLDYHLLPTQIESVLDEKNNLMEEIKYMLPQGLAVNVKHVRELIHLVEE